MKISLNWLRDYVDLPEAPEDVAAALTRLGLPVEAMERTGADLAGFVVGRVVSAERHPNADKLTLCVVDVGSGEPLQIVCGAPNAAAGLTGAVALVGTTLPDGMKIKKAKLRGVESQGMLCSERELGLSEEHQGIIDFGPDGPAPGTPLDRVLPPGDVWFDLDIPSNRGDCFSHVGVARELAAWHGRPLRLPECAPVEAAEPASSRAGVDVQDGEGCPRYLARIIENVTVGPSPEWLVQKLASVGQRSISNVVDVTNFILWELGQPLHAFDYDRLAGHRITVRRARAGERLTTLDGTERALSDEVLVIADADRAVALAGIMGGADSEVTPATTTVLLEGACFNPYRVLRGTRAVRLTTDASLRFVRGVDAAGVEKAIDRCARLLAEVSGGRVLGGRVDVTDPAQLAARTVTWRPGAARRLLGEEISDDEAATWLSRLGFESAGTDRAGVTTWKVPGHRSDVSLECDLVEEVARFHGYERMGERNYNAGGLSGVRSESDRGIDRVRQAWLSLGFVEILSRALSDPDDHRRSGISDDVIERDGIQIPGPQSQEESLLRMSLYPGALHAVRQNLRYGRSDLRLFEVGAVFHRDPSGPLALEPMEVLAVVTAGSFGPDLTRLDPEMDLPRFRGLVEGFLSLLRVDTPEVRCYPESDFETRSSAVVMSCGQRLGAFGFIPRDVLAAWDINRPVLAARFDLSALLTAMPRLLRFREPSRFPASRRDLAFLVDAGVPEAEIAAEIRKRGGALVRQAVLFDRFEGPPLPAGRVSLAYALTCQADDRTLSDDEVRAVEKSIVQGLESRFGAELRDG